MAAATVRAGPDAVRAHPDQLLLALLVEVARAERFGEARAELEDVAHLDRRLDADLAAGRVAVTGLHPSHVDPLGLEVAVGLDARQVHVRPVAARHEAGEPAQRLIGQHRHRGADRPDEPRHGAEVLPHLLALRRPERTTERVLQLDLIQPVVAAYDHEHGATSLRVHRECLDQRARRHTELPAYRLDGRRAGRLDLLGLRLRRRQPLHGLRLGARDLDVRGVAGVGERDVVLTGRAGCHPLVRAEAAHEPHVALHAVPLEARSVEDAVVGLHVEPVGRVEALGVAVEGVGVLHDELARPQQPGARARLVAFLRLEVVEDLGQVAVRAHLARDVPGDVLLVRHREHQVGAAPVLELEQLVDVVAARSLPQLRRLEDGHQHLPRADRVELLADDLLDPPVRPPARREKCP